jgi:hypothetical protein
VVCAGCRAIHDWLGPAVGAWWRVLLFAIVAGVVRGAAFGALAHAATGGRRDFASTPALQADAYGVLVDADVAQQARDLLTTMPETTRT